MRSDRILRVFLYLIKDYICWKIKIKMKEGKAKSFRDADELNAFLESLKSEE